MSDLEDILAIQIKREGLLIPEREYRFHRHRKWKFDFAYPDRKLAIEVEGGIWRRGGGAHSSGLAIIRDIEKYNTAILMGWRVIRLHSEMIFKNDREVDDGWKLIREALLCPFPDPVPSIYDACPTPSG